MPKHPRTLRVSDELYGRESELAVLQEAFQWASLGATELVMISGQPGVGKSALVQNAFKPAVIGRCYFASGKFDQYKTGGPYEPIIKCFQSVIRQLLTEPEPLLQKWIERVKEAVGPNGAVITDVIPEAKLLLGQLPPRENVPSLESWNRFEWVFRRFVQVFTSRDYPLVLFLDDVQWADEGSLRLLHALIVDPESQHLLVIASYRNQERNGRLNVLEKWLQGEHPGYSVRQLSLMPLDLVHIQTMVSDLLQCDPDECFQAAHTLYVKSVGNPFYLKQLLQAAYDEQCLQLSPLSGCWEWNMQALSQFPEIDGQLDYLVERINKIPFQTRELLKIGACLGSKFNIRILHAVSGHIEDELAPILSFAVQEGLLSLIEEPGAISQYQFTHDRIQQAVYSLLNSPQRMEIHLLAGQFLLEFDMSKEKDQALFEIVNHFNQALDLLSAEDREMTARLNEQAGRKAMQSSAYSAALQHFETGIACLTDDFWERHFEFTFQLYLKCAECDYLCAHYEQAEARLNDMLKRARTWTERAQVYIIKIEQYSNTGKYSQAIELGLQALREVGIRISERPHKLVIVKEMLLTKRLLDKRMSELLSLSEIDNLQIKVMMELLVSLVAPTFFSNREVFAIIASKFIRLAYKYGSSPVAPSLYTSYGMLLGTVLGEYQMAYQLGKIALDLAEQSAIASVRCKVHVMFYGVISPWVRYDRDDEAKLEQAAKLGLEAGDYVYASYAVGSLINLSYVRNSMNQILHVNRKNLQVIEHTKEDLVFKNILVYMDMAKKLRSPHEDVFSLTDGRTSESDFLDDVMKDESRAVTLYQIYTYKAQIYYLFERYREAVSFAEQANPYELLSVHAPHLSEHHWYEALSIIAAWDDLPAGEKAACSKRLKRRYRQFKAWDRMAPENFRHKFLLLQAEFARFKGSEKDIIELYDRSILFARERNYFQYQAVACEQAAKYHLQKGRERVAIGYLKEAYEAYGLWGAESKRSKMKRQYPKWLDEPPFGHPQEAALKTVDASLVSLQTDKSEEVQFGAVEIDFTAIVKASTSISQGVDLQNILKQLMAIILETSETEKGCLVVNRNGDLRVETVFAANGESRSQSKSLVESGEVPVSFIQYTSRLEKPVQLMDAAQDDLFRSDPYIALNRCKTVCCLPLYSQEQLSGVLYVEDNRDHRLFSDERLETLRILASQALFIWKLSDSFGDASVSTTQRATNPEEHAMDSLTDRELEVLNLMASGMTNKEIAFQLGVTAGTVKVHIHNIFSKLNVNRRTKAIAEAKKKKILE
ncbi:AAA family ATPase [Paenibacillus sp. HWE-109]|uniref:AAA family ATPase n=1 Tax=Paenibacillus sp. HWE-109 TaxID=1306526 RepID=UPI001EE07B14|nr:AAA family ATPase [Paenibacillus sp. HWE-109]UKS25002.1 AAA family ATPase [Paenibacillus sp. HWE-109]